MPKKVWGTYSEVAKEMGFTRQWVHAKLMHSPVKRNKKGLIQKDEAIKFIKENTMVQKGPQQKALHHGGDGNGTSRNGSTPNYHESNARKEAALAELKEMEVAQKKGQLFDLQEGIKIVSKLAASVKDALASMDERLPAKLATMKEKRDIKAILKAEHAKALKTLEKVTFN